MYVDGFNLFYGGRALCGADKSWKWLDVRALCASVIAGRRDWMSVEITRLVYCTAEVTGSPESLGRQQRYYLALRAHGKVGLGHGNLAARLLHDESQCFAFLAGHESFAAAEGAIKIAQNANTVRDEPLRVILNGLGNWRAHRARPATLLRRHPRPNQLLRQ